MKSCTDPLNLNISQ